MQASATGSYLRGSSNKTPFKLVCIFSPYLQSHYKIYTMAIKDRAMYSVHTTSFGRVIPKLPTLCNATTAEYGETTNQVILVPNLTEE